VRKSFNSGWMQTVRQNVPRSVSDCWLRRQWRSWSGNWNHKSAGKRIANSLAVCRAKKNRLQIVYNFIQRMIAGAMQLF